MTGCCEVGLVTTTCCGGVVTVRSVAVGSVGLRWTVLAGAETVPWTATVAWGVRPAKRSSCCAGEEADLDPAEDVIHDGLGVADLLVAGPAGGLEPGVVGELLAEDAEGNAVLEGEGDGGGEGIHEARDRGAFLGHADKDFAGAGRWGRGLR